MDRFGNRQIELTLALSLLTRIRRMGAVATYMAILLLSLTLISPPLSAQTNGGSIAGNVLDPQGSAIAGAKIHATKVDTGETQTGQSSSAGSYRFDNLNPGIYSILTCTSSWGRKISMIAGTYLLLNFLSALYSSNA